MHSVKQICSGKSKKKYHRTRENMEIQEGQSLKKKTKAHYFKWKIYNEQGSTV